MANPIEAARHIAHNLRQHPLETASALAAAATLTACTDQKPTQPPTTAKTATTREGAFPTFTPFAGKTPTIRPFSIEPATPTPVSNEVIGQKIQEEILRRSIAPNPGQVAAWRNLQQEWRSRPLRADANAEVFKRKDEVLNLMAQSGYEPYEETAKTALRAKDDFLVISYLQNSKDPSEIVFVERNNEFKIMVAISISELMNNPNPEKAAASIHRDIRRRTHLTRAQALFLISATQNGQRPTIPQQNNFLEAFDANDTNLRSDVLKLQIEELIWRSGINGRVMFGENPELLKQTSILLDCGKTNNPDACWKENVEKSLKTPAAPLPPARKA